MATYSEIITEENLIKLHAEINHIFSEFFKRELRIDTMNFNQEDGTILIAIKPKT